MLLLAFMAAGCKRQGLCCSDLIKVYDSTCTCSVGLWLVSDVGIKCTWVVLHIRAPLRVPFVRVPYDLGFLNRGTNLEKHGPGRVGLRCLTGAGECGPCSPHTSKGVEGFRVLNQGL